jgi:predicted Ser/Thr protein kinase
MNDKTPQKCPRCGTDQPPGSTGGVCPRCAANLLQATQTDIPGENTGGFTPPTVAELAAKFPQLEILELIGRGGMGAVYKARQRELDRFVALKILPPDIGKDPAFAERFSREAKALARLNHPGIVTIYDFGRADGLYFFLMEFVDGMNLRELLHNGRISAREALAIVPQICDALQFAHDQGIVHRDIKPENLLLDRRGRVKVADFGLAKLMGTASEPSMTAGTTIQSTTLTEAGKVMGTPNYMSPEQMERPGEVDHRADIYALGVVFYQMLTGELPDKPLHPPSQKVHIDVRLDDVVLRALEKNPERRYQQASALKTQVETIANGPVVAVPPTPPAWYQGVDYKTKRTLFGLPLVHVATGINPATGRTRIARGIVAIGGMAQGVVAVGGVAMGGVTFGGLSLGIFSYGGCAMGLIAIGGLAVGLAVALGGLAVAPVALGGGALGYYAMGGLALGKHTLDALGKNPGAVKFFAPWAKPVMDHFQIVNLALVVLAVLLVGGLPWWLSRRTKRPSPEDRQSDPSAPLTRAQMWKIYGHMTGAEKTGITVFGGFYGFWNSATFFLPFACVMFFPIPVPLNWIVASAVLMVGLAFYPLWWKRQAKLLCSSAWAKEQGIRVESIRTFLPGMLMLLGALWLLLVGGLWWQTYRPEGIWQPWLTQASIQEPNVGGAACVTDVGNHGQIVWLRLTCSPLPRSAALAPAYTGPLIELPYHWPAEATNVDCLITTAPHSIGKIIAGTNDLSGQTNFTIGFVLPDEQAAAVAVKQIKKFNLGRPHGFDSPLIVLRRTLGKDSAGKDIYEEIFCMLQLAGKAASPMNSLPAPNADQTSAFPNGSVVWTNQTGTSKRIFKFKRMVQKVGAGQWMILDGTNVVFTAVEPEDQRAADLKAGPNSNSQAPVTNK